MATPEGKSAKKTNKKKTVIKVCLKFYKILIIFIIHPSAKSPGPLCTPLGFLSSGFVVDSR